MNWYYLKQIARILYRKKFNSLVKITGITFAFIPVILIWSFVKYESGYDRHFTGYENVFRVIRNWQEDKIYGTYTSVPFLLSLMKAFPEIESGTRLWPLFDHDAIVDNRIYNEEVMLSVDSSFFDTFGMSLLEGDKNSALDNPRSVVLSRSMAEKLFGESDPLGKIIEFEGRQISERNRSFTVTGVFEDFPSNSHLKGNFLLSLNTFISNRNSNPTNHMLMTYIRLVSPGNEPALEQKLPEFMEGFYGKAYYDYARSTYLLQPLADIHLDTDVNYNEYETAKGSYSSLYVFPSLVLLIILIASFNFINLTVSEGASRFKAFGINKLWGAGKSYFYRIYIFESLILSILALVAAFFILSFISPLFIKFVERDLDPDFYKNPLMAAATLVFAIFIGIVNGLFPAGIFSGKNITSFLKGNANTRAKKHKLLILSQIVQFAICIFLITGSFMVFKQLSFINSTINEALDSRNVLVITNAEKLGSKSEVFKSELKKLSGIRDVSLCREIPGIADYSHWGLPVDSAAFSSHIAVFNCDYDYLSTLDMQLTEGRFFDPAHPTDENAVVLNETAVRILGWENDPIGKRYRLNDTFSVIGVVKDIHFESFHYEIIPQGFFLDQPGNTRRILVRIEPGQSSAAIANIRQLWNEMVPDREVLYNFLDYNFDFWYKNEKKTGFLAIILTVLAIFLSSLGFLAMLMLSIRARTKEIGIRKVNGARSWEIVLMLNANYVRWVAIAFIIAAPASWYLMEKWLQNFAYRTEISWWIFVMAGIIALAVALLTVSWQSWKAATRNPVESLRYE